MEYNFLGRTGLHVSKICLGTFNFGRLTNEKDAHRIMDRAVDKGVNFFDTAEIYPVMPRKETYGLTEKIIGNWFAERKNRDKIILASKIASKSEGLEWIREGKANLGFDKKNINKAIDNSLKRLQTDYIDLYQLHWPERNTNYFGQRGYNAHAVDVWDDNIHQVLETLRDLIAEGKIRHVGLSNETPWGTMRYLEESKVHQSLPRMMTIQNPYNLLNRLFEVGLSEISMREQIGLLAYSPLGFGTLSGKYLTEIPPRKARVTLFPNYNRYSNDNAVAATEQYAQLAKEHGLSMAQMALAFVNTRPFLTSNIIGATSMEQLKENIGSIDVDLSDEVLEGIEEIHNAIPNPAP